MNHMLMNVLHLAHPASKHGHGPAGTMDIWAVPDSPNAGLPSHSQVIEESHQSYDDEQVITERAEFACMAVDDSGVSNELENEPSPRGKKRRKVNHLSNLASDADGMDLIPLHSSNDVASRDDLAGQCTPANCPDSTLPPINSAFFIAQNPLTNSQKLSYQSVMPPSSAMTEQPQLYPEQPTYQLRLASSGSATNINTPRSRNDSVLLPSTAPWSQDALLAANQEITPSLRQRRGSSPDVISIAVPEPSTRNTQNHTPRNKQKPKNVASAEDVDALNDTVPPVLDEKPETPQAKPVPENTASTQSKKKRGRPKKGAASEAEPPIAAPTETNVEEETPAKGKKKRGRPKKQNAPQNIEEPTLPDTAEEKPIEKPIEQDPQETIVEQPTTTKPSKRRKETKSKAASPSPITPDQSHETDSSVLKELGAGAQKQPSQETPQKHTLKDEPEVLPKSEEKKPEVVKDRKDVKLATLTPGPKPIYRVGLSKKSRIAPLLKCLRK